MKDTINNLLNNTFDLNLKCFNDDGSINYINAFISSVFNLRYISNITVLLICISLIVNNKYFKILGHSLIPLLLTNGIFITLIVFLNFSKFEKKNMKYFCKKKEVNKFIERMNSKENILFLRIKIIITHFWLPLVIYYFGIYKNSLKYTNLILSWLITIIYVSIYSLLIENDRYIIFNIGHSNFIFFTILYLIIHFVINIMYFNNITNK